MQGAKCHADHAVAVAVARNLGAHRDMAGLCIARRLPTHDPQKSSASKSYGAEMMLLEPGQRNKHFGKNYGFNHPRIRVSA